MTTLTEAFRRLFQMVAPYHPKEAAKNQIETMLQNQSDLVQRADVIGRGAAEVQDKMRTAIMAMRESSERAFQHAPDDAVARLVRDMRTDHHHRVRG